VAYITTSQKIHFVVFNLVAVDSTFIGTRTLLHVRYQQSNSFLYIWTIILMTLVVLDVCEIAVMQFGLKFEIFEILSKEKVLQDPNLTPNNETNMNILTDKNFNSSDLASINLQNTSSKNNSQEEKILKN
jgi:hypothetical protein